MSEPAVRVFRHMAILNIFGITGGKVPISVMAACGNSTFNLLFTVKTSLLCLLIQLTN